MVRAPLVSNETQSHDRGGHRVDPDARLARRAGRRAAGLRARAAGAGRALSRHGADAQPSTPRRSRCSAPAGSAPMRPRSARRRSSVGVAAAMRPEDVLLPSFREHGAQLWRGVTPEGAVPVLGRRRARQRFRRSARGLSQLRAGRLACAARGRRGARLPAARRAAGRGLRLRRRRHLEGRRRRGAQHGRRLEGAGRLRRQQQRLGDLGAARPSRPPRQRWRRRRSPPEFPASRSTATTSLRCARVTEQALARARAGDGPSLIEAVTYRLSDHTTADDASRYRDDAEVSRHWPQEPIARLRNYLTRMRLWDKDKEEALLQDCSHAVERGGGRVSRDAAATAAAMFDHTYAELPADLVEQREAATSRLAGAAMTELSLVQAVNLALQARDDGRRARARAGRGRRRRRRRVSRDRRPARSASARRACSIRRWPRRRSPASRSGWRRRAFVRSPRSSSPASPMPASTRCSIMPSRLRARTRGRLTCPMVLRSPAGGGIKAVEHHSESPEAMFAHIPGLKVVDPVVAGARLRAAAVGDPRSRSGGVPGADAALSRRARGRRRRRRRPAARALLRAAARARRDAGVVGRDGHGDAGGRRAARRTRASRPR